jgi:hypothetical protein
MTIKDRFEKELEIQPALSSWMAYVRTVKAGNYKKEIIKKNFKTFVDKEDYVNSGMKNKMEFLYSL